VLIAAWGIAGQMALSGDCAQTRPPLAANHFNDNRQCVVENFENENRVAPGQASVF